MRLPIVPGPAIEAVKVIVQSGAIAGDEVVFEIFVSNTGNVSLTDIGVDDTLTRMDTDMTELVMDPPELVFPATPPATVAPGVTLVYEARYVLTQADVDAGGNQRGGQFLPRDAEHHIGDLFTGLAFGVFHGKADGAFQAFHVRDGATGETARLLAPGAENAEAARAGAVIAADQAGDLRAADIERCDRAGLRTTHTRGTAGLGIGHQDRAAISRALKFGGLTGPR